MSVCGRCHEEIGANYRDALHYTTAGLRNGVAPRLSEAELQVFDDKVFQKSCRSCHASCGDCHVKGPRIGGITTGLIKGHRFIRKDEGKTCGLCHGGRVFPEFTGQYGVIKDAHYEKGLTCTSCHKRDMTSVTTLRLVPTVRDTFEAVGIKMERYDALPNDWDAVPHVVRKTTERTNNCHMCHLVKMGFLTETALIKDGSEANRKLIYRPKPIKK